MKKILFAIFAVAALAMTSCENKGIDIMSLDASQLNNTDLKCWKYTVKNAGKVMGDCVIYAWDTEANVVKVLQELHKLCKLNNCTPILSYEATADADEESCECKNEF
jgi:hypothetical protein